MVRAETDDDRAGVRRVNLAAFPTTAEADLVDALRSNGNAVVSLVAVHAGDIVGHILFSPVRIGDGESACDALGLAPMAVMPEWQKRGVGSKLVWAGASVQRMQPDSCADLLFGGRCEGNVIVWCNRDGN